MSAQVWEYEGSLDSLFLLAERALRSGRAPLGLRVPEDPEPLLFAETAASEEETSRCQPIDAPMKSGSAARAALAARSRSLVDYVLLAWMSEEDVAPPLLASFAAVKDSGLAALDDYSRPTVRSLRGACYRVEREIHRLTGLARFSRRRDGLYTACLEPDHNILPALAPHFVRRFSGGHFALVDLRRRLALAYRGRLLLYSGEEIDALLPDDGDAIEVELWRRYFAAAENPARRNPLLQRRLMPERYWRYLPEIFPPPAPSR